MKSLDDRLRAIVEHDPRFRTGAYEFVLEALEETMRHLGRGDESDEDDRHISAADLLQGIRRFAVERFGYLARAVFETWGVRTTGDFGDVVFNLVEHGLLKRREEDHRSEFDDVYSFDALDEDAIAAIRWPAATACDDAT